MMLTVARISMIGDEPTALREVRSAPGPGCVSPLRSLAPDRFSATGQGGPATARFPRSADAPGARGGHAWPQAWTPDVAPERREHMALISSMVNSPRWRRVALSAFAIGFVAGLVPILVN